MNTTRNSSPNVSPSITSSIPQTAERRRPACEGSALDVVVGLGSNLGDRGWLLLRAVQAIANIGVIDALSPLYETPPLGPAQPDYLNAAVRFRTQLSPPALLSRLQRLEHLAGRERGERWGARTLDLDVLWIEGWLLGDSSLVVPHPGLCERAFALFPLLDVAPDARHPASQRPLSQSADALDRTEIRPTERTAWTAFSRHLNQARSVPPGEPPT